MGLLRRPLPLGSQRSPHPTPVSLLIPGGGRNRGFPYLLVTQSRAKLLSNFFIKISLVASVLWYGAGS